MESTGIIPRRLGNKHPISRVTAGDLSNNTLHLTNGIRHPYVCTNVPHLLKSIKRVSQSTTDVNLVSFLPAHRSRRVIFIGNHKLG